MCAVVLLWRSCLTAALHPTVPLSCSPDLCPASSCKAPSSSKVRTTTTAVLATAPLQHHPSIATAVLSSSPQQQCCVLHHHSIATTPTSLLWPWSGLMLRDKTPADCPGLGWPNTAVGSVFSHPHPAASSQGTPTNRYHHCHL